MQACLNGGRTRSDHVAVPQTPAELAADAVAVRRARCVRGARACARRPRSRDDGGSRVRRGGRRDPCGGTGVAGRPVDVGDDRSRSFRPGRRPCERGATRPTSSRSTWPSSAGRASSVPRGTRASRSRPVSPPPTKPRSSRAARSRTRSCGRWSRSRGGADEARAIPRSVPDGVPQLWHGYGAGTWDVLAAAVAEGHAVRVGFEDVLELPDGRVAQSNAELVEAAVGLGAGVGE